MHFELCVGGEPIGTDWYTHFADVILMIFFFKKKQVTMVQMVRVVQVKEMETVAGDMMAVLDTQETIIIIMGKKNSLTTFYNQLVFLTI